MVDKSGEGYINSITHCIFVLLIFGRGVIIWDVVMLAKVSTSRVDCYCFVLSGVCVLLF